MDIPCSLPTLAGALLLCAASVPVTAQPHRPDAEAPFYTRSAQLSIAQDVSGFSIRARPAEPAAALTIRIGSSVSLDRGLFVRAPLVRTEISHVPQR